MNNSPRTVAKPAPEQARDVRVRAWLYIFACYEKHKAAGEVAGKDASKEIENGRAAKEIVHSQN